MSRHIPVLLNEVVEYLRLRPGMNVIDCTLGDAGHSESILEKTGPDGRLLGIDADIEAILRGKRFLYRFDERIILAKENFVNLKNIVEEKGFRPVHGILIDLGWSMPQFAERGRGFSFEKDEPLDMRYDNMHAGETAADIINNSSAEELRKIFKNYGEEKLSAEIAEAVVEARKEKKIEKTLDLVNVVLAVYREKLNSTAEIPWIGGIHPATKVFQALRIAVNKELEVLKKVLPQAIDILAPGGRLAVISFHSLEDRIVKQYFKSIENQRIKLITKKSVIAGDGELTINPRARSAKLRVVEKI